MDYNLWQQLILGATKPFRTGANILAQNWGSALTGKDMSQRENQGGFLKWLAGSLDQEEQRTITEKPYLSSVKSSAGMASTLMPFASQGLRTAQLAANPLTNRIAQLALQGGVEGSLGGFGLSREGKEVQDTLTGGLAGAGGELFMDYLTNPQFRNMLTDATTTISPRTGARMYKGELGSNEDVLDNIAKLEIEAKNYATPEEFVEAQFNKKPKYGMSHRPTWEGMPTASDLLEGETLPRDVYEHPEWSIASGRNFKTDKAAQESWSALQKIRNKPDAEITVYRATRKKELNPGDWITFSKEYAKDSVEGAAEKVYDFKVKARDVLFAGDDINEFGYYPRTRFEEIWKRAWNLKDSAKELRGGFKEILEKSGLK